ncbi:class I SAM-dependent methyltransferase [Maritimibacter sp. 55A14]|uniref:class I SAM-dependent methyltransferase n=1 Tax=Maritimibacter sp. 55A14 TaxID=2174844 RepID=UPI001304E993|nr:methyltransferase domain-containing protein [Maritimibacter sp. 55A14]
MTDFAEFAERERAGWQDAEIVVAYVEYIAPLTERAGEQALMALNIAPDTEVLDLCCGQGEMTRRACELSENVAGLDFSETMLERAARVAPMADLREGDAAAMPYADASFDAVLCNFGIPHVPDRTAVLSEIARVLRPGGRVALTSWVGPDGSAAFATAVTAIQGMAGPPSIPQPDFFEFSRGDAAETRLSQAGFQLQSHEVIPLVLDLDRPDGLFQLFANATVGIRMLIQSQEPPVVDAIRDAMAAEVEREYRVPEGYRVAMPATITVASLQ